MNLGTRTKLFLVLTSAFIISTIFMTVYKSGEPSSLEVDAREKVLEAKQGKNYDAVMVNESAKKEDKQNNHQAQKNADNHVYLGLAVEPISAERISLAEENLGREFSIVMMYKQWGHPQYPDINVETLNMISGKSKIPLISWEPWKPDGGVNQEDYRLQNIIDGRFDSYIRKSAITIKNYGKPLFLRLAHEMNGNWYPWGGTVNGNASDQYIQAWRHVHNIFSSEGVNNVTWVWAPDTNSYPPVKGNAISDYFPGDAYVDWIGLDGYNWGPTKPGKKWQSFDSVFAKGYSEVTKLSNKPVMISEVASSETGGNKALWIKDAYETQIPKVFTRVKAVVWFDINRDNSWPIESSTAALNQMKTSVGSKHYVTIPADTKLKITDPQ